MICLPGKCIKCGGVISTQGVITPKFNEVEIELENKKRICVGLCVECDLTQEECNEAVAAVYKSVKRDKEPAKAVGIAKRHTFKDIILELQGNCCPSCKKEIGDNYILTRGAGNRPVIMHERCSK